jgi:hypothetical protein
MNAKKESLLQVIQSKPHRMAHLTAVGQRGYEVGDTMDKALRREFIKAAFEYAVPIILGGAKTTLKDARTFVRWWRTAFNGPKADADALLRVCVGLVVQQCPLEVKVMCVMGFAPDPVVPKGGLLSVVKH